MKNLYKGTFNWQGINYTMFTHAISIDKAYSNFITQLKKKPGFKNFSKRNIMYYFNGQKDNYYIEKIKRKEKKNE